MTSRLRLRDTSLVHAGSNQPPSRPGGRIAVQFAQISTYLSAYREAWAAPVRTASAAGLTALLGFSPLPCVLVGTLEFEATRRGEADAADRSASSRRTIRQVAQIAVKFLFRVRGRFQSQTGQREA